MRENWKGSAKWPLGLCAEVEETKSVMSTATRKRRGERRNYGYEERTEEDGKDGGRKKTRGAEAVNMSNLPERLSIICG